jgi:alpha-amylase
MYITTANPFFGGQLYLLSNDKAQPAPVQYLYGDVDLNGNIDVSDASLAQVAIAELREISPLQTALADVDGDGELTVTDVTYLQLYIAEMDADTAKCGKPYEG